MSDVFWKDKADVYYVLYSEYYVKTVEARRVARQQYRENVSNAAWADLYFKNWQAAEYQAELWEHKYGDVKEAAKNWMKDYSDAKREAHEWEEACRIERDRNNHTETILELVTAELDTWQQIYREEREAHGKTQKDKQLLTHPHGCMCFDCHNEEPHGRGHDDGGTHTTADGKSYRYSDGEGWVPDNQERTP